VMASGVHWQIRTVGLRALAIEGLSLSRNM
jgi:hypothetical protein